MTATKFAYVHLCSHLSAKPDLRSRARPQTYCTTLLKADSLYPRLDSKLIAGFCRKLIEGLYSRLFTGFYWAWAVLYSRLFTGFILAWCSSLSQAYGRPLFQAYIPVLWRAFCQELQQCVVLTGLFVDYH